MIDDLADDVMTAAQSGDPTGMVMVVRDLSDDDLEMELSVAPGCENPRGPNGESDETHLWTAALTVEARIRGLIE